MTNYIQFSVENQQDTSILIEIDEEDVVADDDDGVVKVGIRDRLNRTVAIAQNNFSSALQHAIQANVQGLIDAVHSLPDPPSEMEITFGLKATGEASNIAVGKVGGDVNYAIKLTWKRDQAQSP